MNKLSRFETPNNRNEFKGRKINNLVIVVDGVWAQNFGDGPGGKRTLGDRVGVALLCLIS